jgi:alpha-1,2-mannosyltransferase
LFLNSYPDLDQYFLGVKSLNPYLNGVIYPPFALVIFAVFKLFSLFWLGKIWTAFSIVALFLSVYLIFKLYKQKLISILGFIVLGLICLSFPVKFTLGMGQINNFILLIFVAAIYLLQQKKNYLSAFLLSLSFAIKLFPAYLILQFIITKRWKFLFTSLISLSLLSLLAFMLIGPKINLYFYQHLLPALLSGWKTDYYNQSLIGFIGRSFSRNLFSQSLVVILSAFFILTSCLIIFKVRKNKKLLNMSFGLLITLNLIVNNFSWQHHFVFLIFPFLVTLFAIVKTKNNRKLLSLLFISYVWISLNLANPYAIPILLQSHVLYGAILLWILEVYFIWKASLPLRRGFASKARR